jgi:hypothetical protein
LRWGVGTFKSFISRVCGGGQVNKKQNYYSKVGLLPGFQKGGDIKDCYGKRQGGVLAKKQGSVFEASDHSPAPSLA